MIDNRKNKYEIINVVVAFVDECETMGYKIEYVKQLNTKSILNIFVDEFLTLKNFELVHAINDPKKYANTLLKQNVDMMRKIFIAEGLTKLDMQFQIDREDDTIEIYFGMGAFSKINTTTWEVEWQDVQEWGKTTHGILSQITKKLAEMKQ